MNDLDKRITELSNELGLERILIDLLYKRGLTDAASIKAFLLPSNETPTPFCMSQMQLAVDRINYALENGEKILVFGDYDCDGICATSILKLFFDSVNADCVYHIPRRSEGYGLSIEALEQLIEEHLPDLIITVDCGITSIAEVEHCFDLGVDIIVTDHHEPQDELPDCTIVNPKIDENSPFHYLCGAGVALKLVEALSNKQTADNYLDLATIATIADVVPLVGVNRSIVYHGLKLINKRQRPSIKRLLEYIELEKVTSEEIGFRIAPRVNAPGRLSLDIDMVEFFTTDDNFIIDKALEELDKANAKRQTLTKDGFEQALKMLTAEYLKNNKIIVLYNPDWNQGILGLIAAKLAERFYRPVVLLTDAGDVAKGSARSIDGVNIFKCLCQVSNYMLGFGGHSGAAGMSVSKSRIKEFTVELQKVASELDDELFIRKDKFDIEIDRKQLTKRLCDQIELLEPTGEGNPSPIFAVNASECNLTQIPNTLHIKGKLNQNTDIVGFGKDYLLHTIATGAEVMLYGNIANKEYKNREYVQFSIIGYSIKSTDGIRDNAAAFVNYLKTGLIKNEKLLSVAQSYRISEVKKEINNLGLFGTLYIAYSKKTADEFLSIMEKAGDSSSVLRVSVGNIDVNPINTLCLLPSKFDGVEKYSSVVFLDSPISAKFINNLANKYTEPEFVLIPSFAFKPDFLSLETSDEAIAYTANTLSSFISRGKRASNLSELFFSLMSYGYKYPMESFYLHFYVFYELGWVRIQNNFNLSCYAKKPEVGDSSLLSLVRKIKNYFNR